MDMKALIGLLLLVSGHGVSSVIHSLKYFSTASSGVSTFPEYLAVGMVDEVQVGYYDSNIQRIVFKQAWMDQVARDHPDELERDTRLALNNQHEFKALIETVKNLFNQTGGVHILQNILYCEWDEEDGTTDGYNQFVYNGEDFISFDLRTLTWIAPVPQAVPTKQMWDQDRADNEYWKNFITKVCVDWLKKLLAYGKSTLQRIEVPRVSLLQRGPSSPVVCHATGFYPDRVVVFWRRDGQELHEHVDHGEVLPNHDGTFQVSVDLDLASVPQEDWGRYECVVQLKGIEDILTPLDPALIRTNGGKTGLGGDGEVPRVSLLQRGNPNWGKTGLGGDGGYQSDIPTPIIIGFVVLLLAAAAAVVGVFLYKKRNANLHKPVGSDNSSKNSDEWKPVPTSDLKVERVEKTTSPAT